MNNLRSLISRGLACTCLIANLSGLSATAAGQSTEQHEVEIISSEDVGPFRPSNDPDLQQVAEKIVEQTNQFRQSEDLQPLQTNAALQQTAQDFADFMAETNRYGHQADGQQPSQRAAAHDYEYCIVAENIAYHFRTTGIATQPLADQAVTGWKNSPGHRRNMLKPHVTETGVALSQSESTGVYYAVQLFGRPRSLQTTFTLQNRSQQTVSYTLADRSFSLPPRYSRKHQVCTPPELKIQTGDQTIADKKPADGAVLVIEEQGGKLQVSAGGATAS